MDEPFIMDVVVAWGRRGGYRYGDEERVSVWIPLFLFLYFSFLPLLLLILNIE